MPWPTPSVRAVAGGSSHPPAWASCKKRAWSPSILDLVTTGPTLRRPTFLLPTTDPERKYLHAHLANRFSRGHRSKPSPARPDRFAGGPDERLGRFDPTHNRH